ncbi:cell wall hydrolase [Phenylobacterium sp.]|uniref:cell wall hydrolase n=1 Tax=Phenylobacterium sp. TaxID=1871053 RepID=UPI002F424986
MAAVFAALHAGRGPAAGGGAAAHAVTGSTRDMVRLTGRMDRAMLALAARHEPRRRAPDLWGRPPGWGDLDLSAVPDLGFASAADRTAQEINALRPASLLPIRPMRPFVLPATGADGARALQCLSQAVYYEAAREPLKGQQAVAQVVLNRLRHPAYPKSVCGVVYQGAARVSGCQFTFTCDGALRFTPQAALWSRAQAVARRALSGFVLKDVGSATHYHADYVAPYWAPTLVKLGQVGAHIFYRWTGPWGEPPAFTGRYLGGEANLTQAVLQGADPRIGNLLAPEAQGILAGRTVTLAVAGEVRTYTIADPKAEGGRRTRVLGAIYAPRRRPTPDEVREINASLVDLETRLDEKRPDPPASSSPAPAAPPAP